jgi:hypothetical protein
MECRQRLTAEENVLNARKIINTRNPEVIRKRSLCNSLWVDRLRSLKANTAKQAHNIAKRYS